MTHENLFREVDEELERQKYEELWKRYGGLVITAALVIVLGTAGMNGWRNHKMEMHQRATGDLAEILNSKADQAKQIDALESFAKSNTGKTQATFAQLHAAALAAEAGKSDDAIKLYDTVAADPKADHAFRQMADLLSVEVQLDTGDAAKLQERLQPLMTSGEPWRYSAMEVGAFLALRAGEKAKAKQMFSDLSQDSGVPESIGAHASDMLRLFAE